MENKLPPETLGEKIVGANWEGDIAFLQKIQANLIRYISPNQNNGIIYTVPI